MTVIEAPSALEHLADVVLGMDAPVREAFMLSRTPDQLEDVERALAAKAAIGWRSDPASLAHHLDPSYRTPPYVRLLARKFRDGIEGRSPRQIWNLPGRYGKSLLGSQWGPTWAFDRQPSAKFILVSYGQQLADENADGVRSRLRQFAGLLRCQLRVDRQRLDRFVTDEGGGLLAAGLESAIVGFGVNKGGALIIDDPFKNWQAAHSEASRNKVWNEFRGSLRNRLDDEDAFILVIHHRVHEDDLTARLTKAMDDDDEFGDKWDHVVLPALARSGDLLGRAEGEPLDPERFPLIAVRRRAAGMGSYLTCTPAETPILMADWSERPISEVKVGDRVVGFVAEPGHKVRYQPTTVTGTMHKPGVVANYEMTSGRTVRATRDHRWFVRSGRKYQIATVGTPLRQVTAVNTTVTEYERELWAWLAGMVDGEGHIKRSNINIVQAIPRNVAVVDRLRVVLTELGIPFTERHEPTVRDGWSDRVSFDLGRVGWVLRMLIEHTPLAKRDQAAAALYEGSGRTGRRKDPVLAIGNDNAEEIYALETETGNYVAWGYASSNSALEQQNPTPEEGNDVKRAWFRIEEHRPVKADEWLSSWDTKMKDNEKGDYVCGQMWARTGKDCWLVDQLRGKWNQATTVAAVALMAVRWPQCTKHAVEAAALGPEVKADLSKPNPGFVLSDDIAGQLGMTTDEREAVQSLRRRGLGGVVLNPVKGDKRARMRVVTPYIEAGDVHLWENAPYLESYLDEMASFPEGTHDDQVDPTSQALSILHGHVARRRRGVSGQAQRDVAAATV